MRVQGGTLLIPIINQENADNNENSRVSDEDGVCSAVGLGQLGSRAGPGGAFHRHGLFFLLLGNFFLLFFCHNVILNIDTRDGRTFHFNQVKLTWT